MWITFLAIINDYTLLHTIHAPYVFAGPLGFFLAFAHRARAALTTQHTICNMSISKAYTNSRQIGQELHAHAGEGGNIRE
jgi:hypothetical protein